MGGKLVHQTMTKDTGDGVTSSPENMGPRISWIWPEEDVGGTHLTLSPLPPSWRTGTRGAISLWWGRKYQIIPLSPVGTLLCVWIYRRKIDGIGALCCAGLFSGAPPTYRGSLNPRLGLELALWQLRSARREQGSVSRFFGANQPKSFKNRLCKKTEH